MRKRPTADSASSLHSTVISVSSRRWPRELVHRFEPDRRGHRLGHPDQRDFSGRIVGFYDFTTARRKVAGDAVRRVRPRHARRRPDRIERRVSNGKYAGVRPASSCSRCACSTRRRGQDERRHRRARVRGRQQGALQHPDHQPFARPSDLRVGGDRPARAGGRSGCPRRTSSSPRRATTARIRHRRAGYAGITRLATRRRRSPWARRTPAPTSAPTTASPRSARAGRPGRRHRQAGRRAPGSAGVERGCRQHAGDQHPSLSFEIGHRPPRDRRIEHGHRGRLRPAP